MVWTIINVVNCIGVFILLVFVLMIVDDYLKNKKEIT